MGTKRTGGNFVTRLDHLPFKYTTYAVEVAAEHGIDVRPYLEMAGLGKTFRRNTGSEILRKNYYRFIGLVFEHCDIPAYGLQVGQKFTAFDYGVLGYAVASSRTIGDAMRVFLRYQQIAGSDGTFRKDQQVEDGNVIIQVRSDLSKEELYRFDVEKSVGQWFVDADSSNMASQLFFSRINFTFSRPDYADRMEAMLMCPLYFEQSANEIYIPEDRLTEPSAMAEEITTELCKRQCEKLLQNIQNQGGLAEQVKRVIINQPGQRVRPEEIARQLNISYRTLRRRLSEEGISFKQIDHELRMRLATQYLRQTQLTTQEISFLLGYSEATNFHRVFKKWTTCTPGEYREAGRAG